MRRGRHRLVNGALLQVIPVNGHAVFAVLDSRRDLVDANRQVAWMRSHDARVHSIDRAEWAKLIARAEALRVVAREKIAAACNLCHRARNLCNTGVLRRTLDNYRRLPG